MLGSLLKPLLIASTIIAVAAQTAPVTSTVYGAVQGRYIGNIVVFLGVPYAAPPVGNLRFKKPENPQNWTATKLCTAYRPACMQKGMAYDAMSEDCLYLNVITPSLNKTAKLPVMLFIHGGGFVAGAVDVAPEGVATNFAARGVVIVSIAYRLSSFGFFTTLTSDYPANVALYDQAKSLEWVQKNIANFGGDADRLTIFGESSGGWSVSFLSYSPVSQNLFRQLIIQSGTALSPHAMIGPRFLYDPSKDFAIKLGCITENQWNTKTFTGLQQCFLTKNSSEVLEADREVPENDLYRPNWVPQVDGPGGFLPEPLDKLALKRIASTKVIIGQTKDETAPVFCLMIGSCTMSNFTQDSVVTERDRITAHLQGKAQKDVNAVLDFAYGPGYVAIAPDDHYTWMNRTDQILSDYMIGYPSRKELDSWQKINSTVYMYSFDYVSTQFPWASIYPAVPHALDVGFMFNLTSDPMLGYVWTPNAEDSIMMNVFGTMWTNFAKSGDPNYPVPTGQPTWTRATQNNAEYYSLTPKSSMKKEYFHLAYTTYGTLIPQILSNYFPRYAALCNAANQICLHWMLSIVLMLCAATYAI